MNAVKLYFHWSVIVDCINIIDPTNEIGKKIRSFVTAMAMDKYLLWEKDQELWNTNTH